MSTTCNEIQIGQLHLWQERDEVIELVPEEFRLMLAPATHCLREWANYWAECAGADVLRVGGDRVKVSHGRFKVRFENQLGISQLQPYVGSQPLSEPLYVEVISPKFPTPSEHCAFYRRLLEDLFARAARIPFAASALTARGVTESLRPPSPLFVLDFLCCWGQMLRTALAAVLGQVAYFFAAGGGEISKVVVFTSAWPLVTVFVAAAWLGESLAWQKLLGTALVIGGLIVLTASGKPREES